MAIPFASLWHIILDSLECQRYISERIYRWLHPVTVSPRKLQLACHTFIEKDVSVHYGLSLWPHSIVVGSKTWAFKPGTAYIHAQPIHLLQWLINFCIFRCEVTGVSPKITMNVLLTDHTLLLTFLYPQIVLMIHISST